MPRPVLGQRHLINLIEPNCEFSLGNYLELAEPILENILGQNKYAIVVGGTGFYLRGLLENLNLPEVKPDLEFRISLKNIATPELYAELKAKDLNNIYKMHFNDRPRIIRALEIIKANLQNANANKTPNFQMIWLGINYTERQMLRTKIQERTQTMLANGLIEETQNLINEFGELEIFQKTIGYKECLAYLKNQIPNLNQLAELIGISTSQYAKRQMTWFRANKAIHWLSAEKDLSYLIEKAKMLVSDSELVD